MRREGRRPVAAMDRKSCMRREGTPAWMQVVERRLEQAAEEARSRSAKAGIQLKHRCHSFWRRLRVPRGTFI